MLLCFIASCCFADTSETAFTAPQPNNRPPLLPAPHSLPPSPYRAVYGAVLDHRGFPFPFGVEAKGEAIRELSVQQDGIYKLHTEASASLPGFFIKIWLKESSSFSWNSELSKLKPVQYEYQRLVERPWPFDIYPRKAVLKFDWEKNRVRNNVQNRPWNLRITEDTLDKLNYQLQIRLDLNQAILPPNSVISYRVADGGSSLQTYRFAVIGDEIIDTPVGKLNTLKVLRLTNKKDKQTTLWLAKDYEFLLVRMERQESPSTHVTLFLKQATLAEKNVVGLSMGSDSTAPKLP